MMRAAACALLLMLPAAAWAKGTMGVSPETVGQIIAALVTVLGGGGGLMWWRRHQHAAEGREDLSTRAKVAIARDNDEKMLRERIEGYHAEVASLRGELREALERMQTLGAALGATAAEASYVRGELDRLRSAAERRQDLSVLMSAMGELGDRLDRTLDDIRRRGGPRV